jgi:hypothetical protein
VGAAVVGVGVSFGFLMVIPALGGGLVVVYSRMGLSLVEGWDRTERT